MSAVRPGDVIAGKFQIERVLGEGGMGYVVAAKHLQLGQTVALKFMRDEVSTAAYKSRFLREARNTVRLKSKHVSRVLDVGALDGGAPYMVMEYLEGTDLSDYLHKRLAENRGPVPVHEACEYLIQACEAIAEAHSHGIVHRDLKPANLFLTTGSGGEPVVKVLDFGVSKVLDLGMEDDTSPGGRPRHPDSVVTKVSDLLGSPSYMAPEQVISAKDADARSDVWSLGVILFRLVSGKAPFNGASLGELIQQIMHGPLPNLREAKPDIPPGLEHVVARCLERERDRRLADVGELARALAPYAGPTATPSLERIALLGNALVTVPPPQPSGPTFGSGGGAWASHSVQHLSRPPPRRDISSTSAIVMGGLFFVVVACGVMAFVRFVPKSASAPAAEPFPQAMPIEPAPPTVTLPTAEPAILVSASSSPAIKQPPGGPATKTRRLIPAKTDPKPGDPKPGEIPATRE